MLEWEVPTSPTARGSFSTYSATHQWGPNFPSSPASAWKPFATVLQPSTSIWGPQIQKEPARTNYGVPSLPEEMPLPLNCSAAVPVFPQAFAPNRFESELKERQRRLSSVPSLALSTSSGSSSYWSEDNYMASPPSSPDSSVLSSSPSSPQLSPTTQNKLPIMNQAVPGHAIGNEVEEITISPSCGPLYLVQFKGGRLDIFTAPGTSYYSPGNSVMVDADRGSDLGEVIRANISRHEAICFKQRQNKDRSRASSASHVTSGEPQSHEHNVFVPKQIIGPATPNNLRDMAAKSRDEAAAVAVCNAKVAERGLKMEIVDAEYQWDRRKLTFFYNADTRVDFRDLVRDLFRVYKTRIWMCATTAR